MPSPTELRLFVSSTFRDMQRERDILVRTVFPEIRTLCRARGASFTDIDLRWGVTEQEAEEGRVVRICLEEIDRCQPHFLGLIGNRYGWQPGREDLAADADLFDDFALLDDAVTASCSVTEMEILHRIERDDDQKGTLHFYLLEEDASDTGTALAQSESTQAQTRLADLRNRIEADPEISSRRYREPQDLASLVRADLIALVDRTFPESATPRPIEIERRNHADFARSRLRSYVPNEELADRLDTSIATKGRLVLFGPRGTGKSSLAAWWCDRYRTAHPEARVIEHYCGTTGQGNDRYALMARVVEEIDAILADETAANQSASPDELFDHHEKPESAPDLSSRDAITAAFADRLDKVGDRPILILFDAVNLLGDEDARLYWLPDHQASGVRIVVTTTDEATAARLQSENGWTSIAVPPLDRETCRNIITRLLEGYRKRLRDDRIDRIVDTPLSRTPIYLRTLLEEMRIFGRHEDLDALLDELLGCTTIEALFDRLLARLEEDFGVASTTLFFSLLGCSESGLSERALTEIGAEIGGITRLDISALLPALDYHLMRQEGRLDFFHDFLRRAVASRYLADSAQETTLRRHIVTVLSHGEVNAWRTREVARQLHALDEKQELGRFLSRPERFLAFIGSGANIEYLQLWQSLDTHVDVVASFADTYDDGPLESSEILPYSRVDYLYRLASFFGTISRWSAAEPLLRRLATLDETERSEQWRCRLLINLGSALFYQHKLAEAEEIYEQAREIAEEIGDLVAERQIIGNLANVYEVLGKPQDARKATDMHLASFAQVRDEPAHARALLLSADLHRAAGEVEQAQGQYDEAIRIARRQDDPQLVCACLGNLAICQKRLGDTDGAMQNFQEVLAISERHGYLQSIATACSQIASIDQRRGNLDEAVTGYERCVAIGQRLDDDKTRRLGLSGLGHIYYHRGEFDRARVIIDETLGIAERMNDPQEISAASTLAGAVCLQIEEPDQALTHFERARQAEEQSGNRYGIGTAIGNIGCVHHARRAYGAALASFAEALEIHRSIEQPEPVIDWLIDRVKVVFDIIGASEDPPEELLGLLSDEPTDDWRNAARTFVGESLDEATQLAEQIEFHHVMPSIAALRERIDEPV